MMNIRRRHLVVGSLPLGIAVLFVLAFSMTEVARNRDRSPTVNLSADQARLMELLGGYRRAWRSDRRSTVVEQIREAGSALAEPMRWLLSHKDHDYLPEAAMVAGEAGFVELRPRLTWLALQGPARCRPHAILAAAKLGSWDPAELEDLLHDPDPAVQAAAIGACAVTGTRRVFAMIPLLSSAHTDVRNAVVDALPAPLTEEELQVLLAFATETTGPGQLAALQVLRAGADHPEVEAALLRLAAREDPHLRLSALQCLSARTEPLRDTEEIVSLAMDSGLPVEHRAEAMLCLERTRSPVMGRVQRELVYLGPEMRYFVGRYLLAMGEQEGAAVLLGLLEELELGSVGLSQKAAGSLLHETRRTLALVSGRDMTTSIDEWRASFEETGSVPSVRLPPPALYFEPSGQ